MLPDRYVLVQRIIHWLIALLVVGMLAAGGTLGIYGFEGLRDGVGIEATNLIYKYHKTTGIIVLALMLLRVALRAAYPPPPYSMWVGTGFRFAGRLNHFALYALLIAQPLVGWSATAAGGFPIEFFEWKLPPLLAKDPPLSEALYALHGAIGTAIAVLVVLHAIAALYHWRARRDGVMERMTFG